MLSGPADADKSTVRKSSSLPPENPVVGGTVTGVFPPGSPGGFTQVTTGLLPPQAWAARPDDPVGRGGDVIPIPNFGRGISFKGEISPRSLVEMTVSAWLSSF